METNGMAETPKRSRLVRRAGKLLIGFLVIMTVLTYLSRFVSERLMAKVSTGYCSAASLDESVEGTGVWAARETALYTTYYARRITKVYVRVGETVSEGEPLFAYDVATVDGGKEVSDRTVRAAERAVRKAEEAPENATDAAYAAHVLESARQALRYAQFTHAQTYAIQHGGVVRATFSGTVAACDLVAGKASVAGSTGFTIAPNGIALTLTVAEKEAGRIRLGDAVTLINDGKAETEPLTVEQMLPPDADGEVMVVCTGLGGRERLIGAKQEWRIEKRSDRYQTCVPVSALRQSGPDTYYVLVLGEKQTILGTQLVAERREVTLLKRDSSRAAVDGNIGERNRLITDSSKELKDGDYVALNHA